MTGRAKVLANYLTGLGAGKNSIVGLCLDRTVDMLVAILGVLRMGAAYAPLAPDTPADRKAWSDAQNARAEGHPVPKRTFVDGAPSGLRWS